MGVWISFDEQEPPMNQYILACTKEGIMMVTRRKMRIYGRGKVPKEGYAAGCSAVVSRKRLLAWMPLPPMPDGKIRTGGEP